MRIGTKINKAKNILTIFALFEAFFRLGERYLNLNILNIGWYRGDDIEGIDRFSIKKIQ